MMSKTVISANNRQWKGSMAATRQPTTLELFEGPVAHLHGHKGIHPKAVKRLRCVHILSVAHHTASQPCNDVGLDCLRCSQK